jgi:hypothetical protein
MQFNLQPHITAWTYKLKPLAPWPQRSAIHHIRIYPAVPEHQVYDRPVDISGKANFPTSIKFPVPRCHCFSYYL